VRLGDGKSKGFGQAPYRRKVSGMLWHSVQSLKKAARLLSKDCSEVLKILKKKVHKR